MIRWFFVVLILSLSNAADAKLGYFRFPSLHGEIVTFTAEGDLWSVPVAGGKATRLTTHHALEYRKAISPDGTKIAFNAAYEGETEVWLMPIDGGLPKRMTFEGHYMQVQGWTPDGKVLCSTGRYSGPSRNLQLVEIDPVSFAQELLPLHQASEGVWNDEKSTLFFTRFNRQSSYTKRYKGGTAQNLWKWSPGAEEAVPLTADYPGTSRYPMWSNERVYFVSDRDGTMNIWSMNPEGGELNQQTEHEGFDVHEPSLHDGRIVYQLGADLHLYDIATDTDRIIEIELVSDFEQTREKWITDPANQIHDVAISPSGDRVALVSRGRMFVTPVKDGRIQEVSRKKGVRYRDVTFSQDGKSLFALSDETGEFEFWKFELEGIDKRKQITHDGEVLRNGAVLSPDGKRFLWQDKNLKLWVYDLARNQTSLIAASMNGSFSGLDWSPDSKWITYSVNAENDFAQIWLYDVEHHVRHVLTSDRIDAHDPVWSTDGNRLFFIVDQHLSTQVSSPWGMRQPEPFFDDVSYIYELPLKTGLRSAFEAPNEATRQLKPTIGKFLSSLVKNGGKADQSDLARYMKKTPVPPGNYSALKATAQNLFFIHREKTGSKQTSLRAIKVDPEPGSVRSILNNVSALSLSLDRKKVLAKTNGNVYVFDGSITGGITAAAAQVKLANWSFSIDPREEWKQMFVDAWRMERDYFYDRGLHGVDWQKELDRHLPLVDRVTDRSELSDLLTQIVGELEALHIFVVGGDVRKASDDVKSGSLGVQVVRDDNAGGFRISHIPRWDPDYPEEAPALLKSDPDIQEGDVLLEVEGVRVLDVAHPALLLRNKVGQNVLLKIRLTESNEERPVLVKTISTGEDSNLHYSEWEYTRRQEVEQKGESEIGYIHLRAMGTSDMNAWVRQFFPVYRRQGLIIDVRYNNGGNIDSWILNRLLRKAWFFWQPRVGHSTWNMHYAYRGHVVVLCNEWTASDGEAFTEGAKRLGIATVIGTRTWGGEIWLSRNNPLVDGGIATAAQTGVFGPEGKWLIEGHGVDPDIVVDNLPHETFKGRDRQLEAAIDFLNKKIAEDPYVTPDPPPYYRRLDVQESPFPEPPPLAEPREADAMPISGD